MSASATIAETSITGFQRRFAGIPVPGVTDPRIVAGITIPAVPENVNTSTNLGQTQSTTADKTTRRQKLAIARRREKLLTISEIESVEFSLFSTSEIDTYAVVNVTSEKEYGENSVRDPKLGPHNDSQTCETCSGDLRGCPGHFGKIQIPRLMHPMAVETIILVLSCVCNSCGGLLRLNVRELTEPLVKLASGESKNWLRNSNENVLVIRNIKQRQPVNPIQFI
jgi:hypothetical protein